MADYGRDNGGNVGAIKSDGTEVSHVDADGGVTLGVATYYFPVGSWKAVTPSQTQVVSIHLKWAAAVAATITLETSNFPRYMNGVTAGPSDVTDISTTAGDWIQQNAPGAYVPVTGSGNSATAMTVTAGGSAAGGCEFDLAGIGARRIRIKVVATVGGVVRCNVHGKAGS